MAAAIRAPTAAQKVQHFTAAPHHGPPHGRVPARRNGFDSIVADKLLAHKPAKLKGVASVYQRHDFAAERRKAAAAYARYH
jgi:hypothetical protein